VGDRDHRCALGTNLTSESARDSKRETIRQIPPFKKRRVGHPADLELTPQRAGESQQSSRYSARLLNQGHVWA
jgi:hypothetical protein